MAAAGSTSSPSKESEVIVKDEGSVHKVILNRPKALNALNLPMVRTLTPLYKKWQTTPNIVLMRGSGDKAFCAGGDIVAIYEAGKKKDPQATQFFREEYILNYLIAQKKFAHVALLNGVTMGGGVGLSVHGEFRVATDSTLFAMPETAIGFFCDVGGSYFLPRLPSFALGMYLALTGARLKGPEVFIAGVATHFVKADKFSEAESLLASCQNKEALKKQLAALHTAPDATQVNTFWKNKDAIEDAFSQNTVEKIIARLQAQNTPWAKQQLETLSKMSPTSLKVVHRQLHLGRTKSYAECFQMEYRMAKAFMKHNDFYEGVRALLVDKDKNPKWKPATLAEVSEKDVDEYFQPVEDELIL
jgi:3-hydroxyisobutyryl-CoA hydrolase